jgi:glycosyltransferase involved in cell wall biosynthesis
MVEKSFYPNSPLSVAWVSPGWPQEAMANGIVSYTASIIRGLSDLGTRCFVLTSRPLGDHTDAFVRIIRPDDSSLRARIMRKLNWEAWSNRAFCDALLREVRELRRTQGLGVLELEESYGWARLLKGKCPVPLVVRLHGPWFLNGVANGVRQDDAFARRDGWEKAGLESATAVTAPSLHVLEQTRSHFGLELPGAEVIANPVENVGLADRWKLQECDRNRIAFIGRFDRHKGGDLMIDAFAQIQSQFPDARLDFVGPDRGCVDESGHLWNIEPYLLEKLGASARQKVHYHGFQPGAKAAELRKRALVTVAPSRYETFGIAAAEAMMAGCPLVVSRAGALTELVQDDCNGLVAAAADPADIASKVLSLLKNPERAAQLGEQAARDAAERYAPPVVARQTLEFYRRTIA